ncbi:MAG: hypothetical protein KA270_02255 [Saprospiraceae bacterium]|nr:hypothetical protein [Saprospiraceae bacterium]MBP6565957.1 hypothetical protein [Saprospiraceae bacterium]
MINNGKAKIDKTNGRLNIVIPSKKNWFALIFGMVWLVGWFFGFLSASDILFSSGPGNSGADGFMTIWLMGWTIAGLAISVLLIWGFFGEEKFIMDRNEILFEKTVFGIGKKSRLDISERSLLVMIGMAAIVGLFGDLDKEKLNLTTDLRLTHLDSGWTTQKRPILLDY